MIGDLYQCLFLAAAQSFLMCILSHYFFYHNTNLKLQENDKPLSTDFLVLAGKAKKLGGRGREKVTEPSGVFHLSRVYPP